MQTSQDIAAALTRRAALAGVAVMVLTTVHHAIGAVVYRTPWRLHIALLAVPTIAVLLGALAVHRRRAGAPAGRAAFVVLAAVLALVPIAWIGAFEGLYNHVLKDALYFLAPRSPALLRLFPPPTYVMPDNAIFEITGVLQVVPAWVAATALARRSLGSRTARSSLIVRSNHDVPRVGEIR
ncbi:hypothetical protein WMF31_37420 [Sorangium sp. So ce1036]|uniref:hypothetical protein n=1 Tax=Sorangium sp. So ce1036 TaxID=3133328 RepID=UPI003F11BF17